MGKIYKKPDIVFESFSLSTSIAAGCEVKTHLQGDGVCGMKFGPVYVFIEGINNCTYKPPLNSESWMDEKGNSFCYHNPSEDSNLFNS